MTIDAKDVDLQGLSLGERVTAMRVRRGMKLRTLARIAGINAGNLSKMEQDKIGIPVESATKIANALDCKRDLFLQDDAQ